jgi:Tol biopolymer transport system component
MEGRNLKKGLRFIILGGVALMVALALTGCGDSGHENFVFMRDTASGATVRSARHIAAAGQKAGPVSHTARLRASVAADIAAGTMDVYKGNSRSTSITRLNSVSGDYNSVRLCPDGKTVAFTAWDSNGWSQVYVADVHDFDNPTQLTTGTSVDYYDVNCTPDSTGVLADAYGDGQAFAWVDIATQDVGYLLPPGFDNAWFPNLTPDMNSIVFEGYPTGGTTPAIYMTDIDGNNPVQLTNLDSTYWDWSPSLSRDGKTIAFNREDGEIWNIYSVPIEGEDVVPATQLTDDGFDNFVILPNRYAIFASYVDNVGGTFNDNMYSVRSSGGSVFRITTTDMEDNINTFD